MYSQIKDLFGKYLFGVDELKNIFKNINSIEIPYDIEYLTKYKDTHILILGSNVSIKNMLPMFNMNPDYQPCFYNQDWYLNEEFINKKLENKWYLVRKELKPESRGKLPDNNSNLSSAVLLTYTFFANYIINNEILWKHDFIWCSDVDHNDDQVYVGRYLDPDKINKDGFNIHRHLKIKNNLGIL